MKANKFITALVCSAAFASLNISAKIEHHTKHAAKMAQTDAAAEAHLAQLLTGLTTMKANFTQNSYDIHGKLLQKSSGIMALQRPGKFRWNIKFPHQQMYIADGTYLWTYDAALAQATKQPLNAAKNNNPASLLSGSVESLQQRFYVTETNNPKTGQWFMLRPKAKNDLFRSIGLHFKDNQLNEMKLSDNLGQLSTFVFTNIQVNTSLPATLFLFAPPKAVDVISN